ncbi:MAG: hypothetical protein COB66_01365 [Coxiella sp. (in: Bacteria)]|nr:MAG: hypothetical protein COB66_01365 [Coxiella sp. (in: g-proteobacteria)]
MRAPKKITSAFEMVMSDISYKRELPGKDIWQTYAESIKKGADCEDLKLAMRQALLLKGYKDQNIQLIAGRLLRGRYKGEMHMVLRVVDHGQVWILDSLLSRPKPFESYMDRYLKEEYLLSHTGLYYHGHKFMERDLVPKWQRYQRILREEMSEKMKDKKWKDLQVTL